MVFTHPCVLGGQRPSEAGSRWSPSLFTMQSSIRNPLSFRFSVGHQLPLGLVPVFLGCTVGDPLDFRFSKALAAISSRSGEKSCKVGQKLLSLSIRCQMEAHCRMASWATSPAFRPDRVPAMSICWPIRRKSDPNSLFMATPSFDQPSGFGRGHLTCFIMCVLPRFLRWNVKQGSCAVRSHGATAEYNHRSMIANGCGGSRSVDCCVVSGRTADVSSNQIHSSNWPVSEASK